MKSYTYTDKQGKKHIKNSRTPLLKAVVQEVTRYDVKIEDGDLKGRILNGTEVTFCETEEQATRLQEELLDKTVKQFSGVNHEAKEIYGPPIIYNTVDEEPTF